MLKLCTQLFASSIITENIIARSIPISLYDHVKNFHLTSSNFKKVRADGTKIKVGNQHTFEADGETTIPIDANKQEDIFPDENTPNRLFNGIPYKDLPILNIKSSKNNTIVSLTNAKGKILSIHSAGIEGFKNARKGTNIAAQQTSIAFGTRVISLGYDTVRVKVQGLGAGRMAAIKGLQMGGLNIVSVTDDTRVTWNPLRPRKPRRL